MCTTSSIRLAASMVSVMRVCSRLFRRHDACRPKLRQTCVLWCADNEVGNLNEWMPKDLSATGIMWSSPGCSTLIFDAICLSIHQCHAHSSTVHIRQIVPMKAFHSLLSSSSSSSSSSSFNLLKTVQHKNKGLQRACRTKDRYADIYSCSKAYMYLGLVTSKYINMYTLHYNLWHLCHIRLDLYNSITMVCFIECSTGLVYFNFTWRINGRPKNVINAFFEQSIGRSKRNDVGLR